MYSFPVAQPVVVLLSVVRLMVVYLIFNLGLCLLCDSICCCFVAKHGGGEGGDGVCDCV